MGGGGSYSGVNRIFLMGQEIGRGCEQSAAQQLRRTTEDAKRQRSKGGGAGWVLVEVAPPVKAWGCNPENILICKGLFEGHSVGPVSGNWR